MTACGVCTYNGGAHSPRNLYTLTKMCMLIPDHLPKFQEKKTLIVVAGGRCVRYFKAHNGTLEETGESCVEPLTYLDNEGFFLRAGGGEVYGAGSVLEPKKQEEIRRFVKTLAGEIRERFGRGDYEESVLFVPRHLSSNVCGELERGAAIPVSLTIEASVSNEHPTELLERIERAKRGDREEYVPVTEEESKIQDTYRRAQRTVKNPSKNL